jgi:hypothetical protein
MQMFEYRSTTDGFIAVDVLMMQAEGMRGLTVQIRYRRSWERIEVEITGRSYGESVFRLKEQPEVCPHVLLSDCSVMFEVITHLMQFSDHTFQPRQHSSRCQVVPWLFQIDKSRPHA